MVLGAVDVGIVGKLVVVPDRDEGMLSMCFLEVGIAAVLPVADAIVGQRDGLVAGQVRTRERGVGVHAGGVLVDVVAEADPEVEIGARGDGTIRVVVTVLIVRAGREDEARVRGRGR